MKLSRRGILIGAASGAGAALLGMPAIAAPATIRFASVGGATDAPLYLGEALGLFEKAGFKLDRQRMSSAPNLITALATGQVEVAGISITPGLFTAPQQNINIKVVGDKQSLRPGFSATRLIIRSDLAKATEAENMAALKGKSVAVSAKSSSVYMLLVDLLTKHKMKPEDIKVVELSYPNMLPALTSKAIDACIHLEPFLSRSLKAGVAKLVSDLTEFVPASGGTIVPLVYSEKFAGDKAPATEFMKVYMQGVRIYNDAFIKNKDKEKVIGIVAKGANVDPVIIREGFPAGLDPNQRVSIPFLDRLQQFFIAQNLMRKATPAKDYADLSFADAAVKALGQYA